MGGSKKAASKRYEMNPLAEKNLPVRCFRANDKAGYVLPECIGEMDCDGIRVRFRVYVTDNSPKPTQAVCRTRKRLTDVISPILYNAK